MTFNNNKLLNTNVTITRACGSKFARENCLWNIVDHNSDHLLYRPNNTKNANLLEHHIIEVVDNYLVRYRDAGIIVTGDFNRMNVKAIQKRSNLNFPTRNDTIQLDLILTNISVFLQHPNNFVHWED